MKLTTHNWTHSVDTKTLVDDEIDYDSPVIARHDALREIVRRVLGYPSLARLDAAIDVGHDLDWYEIVEAARGIDTSTGVDALDALALVDAVLGEDNFVRTPRAGRMETRTLRMIISDHPKMLERRLPAAVNGELYQTACALEIVRQHYDAARAQKVADRLERGDDWTAVPAIVDDMYDDPVATPAR